MRFAIIFSSLLAFAGCNTEQNRIDSFTETTAVSAVPVTDSAETADVKTVAVTVTGMMCPHGCFPEVKKLIASSNKTESIELTPQEKEDTINNPVVLVKYRGELNKDATTKAILEAGFEKVEYADQ
jgi:copper chaperone CopZ